jgi:hypothetical protein
MGNLEIGGAEQAEAAARAITGQVARDDSRDRWIAIHPLSSFALSAQKPKQYSVILHGAGSAERAWSSAF